MKQAFLKLAVASILVMASATASAEPGVVAAAANFEAAAGQVTTIINSLPNGEAAKAAKPQLTEAFKRYAAADKAFNDAFAKAKPKNDDEGRAMEKAMETYQKAASAVSEATQKSTERPGVGGEIGTAMMASSPAKGGDAPKTAKQ